MRDGGWCNWQHSGFWSRRNGFESAGQPLVSWVLDALADLQPVQTVVVVQPEAEEVEAVLGDDITVAVQDEQLGTGHATRMALGAMDIAAGDQIVVLPGDTPLLTSATLNDMLRQMIDSPRKDPVELRTATLFLPSSGLNGRLRMNPTNDNLSLSMPHHTRPRESRPSEVTSETRLRAWAKIRRHTFPSGSFSVSE